MEFFCEKCGRVPLFMTPDEVTDICESGGGHVYVVKDPGSMVQYSAGQRFEPQMMIEKGKYL